MNKKAITATMLVILVIGVAVILIFAGQINWSGKKMGGFFGMIKDKFFPSQITTVTIPGTTVGGGGTVETVDNAETLAKRVIACWKDGQKNPDNKNIPLCFVLRPSEAFKGTINPNYLTEADLKSLLNSLPDGKGVNIDWDIPEKLVGPGSSVTICYDADIMGSGGEVFITYDPVKQCS